MRRAIKKKNDNRDIKTDESDEKYRRNHLFIIIALISFFFNAFARDWTVLFYLCADNSLADAATELLEKISRFGQSPQVKIVCLIDRPRGTEVYEIEKGRRNLLLALGERDLASLAFFKEFIVYCRDNYPAKNYILFFYDHGNGWYPTLSPLLRKACLYDGSSGNSVGVSNGELRAFFKTAQEILRKKVSIVGFDACLMGMIEVLYEIKEFASICFASPTLVSIDAYDYEGFLDTLEKNPRLNAWQLGRIWIELVRKKGSEGVYGAYNLSALYQFNLKKIRDEILKKERGMLWERRKESSTYPLIEREALPSDPHTDLLHFLSLLGTKTDLGKIILGLYTSEEFKNSSGLAVWFPTNYGEFKRWSVDYLGLEFNKAISWLKVLSFFYGIDDIKPTEVELIGGEVGSENDFNLSWSSSFDLSGVSYQLFSFSSAETVLFEDCSDFARWEGDFLKAGRFNSPPSAFYSGAGSNLNKSLTLKEELTLPEGGILSLYLSHQTEEVYYDTIRKRDIFYIEVSSGQGWETVDSIYGGDLRWRRHTYLIPATEGLKIRFRYLTDSTTNQRGVFIDDILLLSLHQFRRYGREIKRQGFYIFNQPRGGYNFFVRPVDSLGNKGFISNFLSVEIKDPGRPFSLPSPFSSATKIFLDVDFPKGDILIIDALGRRVRKLSFEGPEVLFDGRDKRGRSLPPGVYFIKYKDMKGGKICKTGR